MFVICLLKIIFENLLPKMSQWRSALSKFYKLMLVERKCNKTEKTLLSMMLFLSTQSFVLHVFRGQFLNDLMMYGGCLKCKYGISH